MVSIVFNLSFISTNELYILLFHAISKVVDVNGDVTEVHTIPSLETAISLLLPPTTHCVPHHSTEKPLAIIDVPRGVNVNPPSFEYAIELVPEPTAIIVEPFVAILLHDA